MPKFIVTIVEQAYVDYTVEADSPEEAKTIAVGAHMDREFFESLAVVQDGLITLDDEGTINTISIEVSPA